MREGCATVTGMVVRMTRDGRLIGQFCVGQLMLASLTVAVTGCQTSSPLPKGDGAVVEGLDECVAGTLTHPPDFVAGQVLVLRGNTSETPW